MTLFNFGLNELWFQRSSSSLTNLAIQFNISIERCFGSDQLLQILEQRQNEYTANEIQYAPNKRDRDQLPTKIVDKMAQVCVTSR